MRPVCMVHFRELAPTCFLMHLKEFEILQNVLFLVLDDKPPHNEGVYFRSKFIP